jgi:prefoldin subunit 5
MLTARAAGRAGAARGGAIEGDEAMATLREAVSQLDAAIKHLEKTLESKADAGAPEPAELSSALEAAKRRNEELTAVTDQVGERLDRAVARVSAVLES